MTKLPYYFYDINSRLPDGRLRWYDEFSDEAPSIIQPDTDLNPAFVSARSQRNEAYSRWQAAFFERGANGEYQPLFKPKTMKWQAIRILSFKHSESSSRDWWEHYQDALFRVFVEPETVYYSDGTHKQWYLLSPEDGYLVNYHELSKTNAVAPRAYSGLERYLSNDPRLRRARFVPVECAKHFRHETSAGELPEGL